MTDSQMRSMALQLAWLVRELARNGGGTNRLAISVDAVKAAERVIAKVGFAPSNSVVADVLNAAADELFTGPAE